jgi:pyroglutamyl-peptidase
MGKTRRILVYGFGPYRQFRENITAKIVKALARAPQVRRAVFRVRFQRSQFVRALERHKPNIVLGLGQSSRRKIEIETQAVNRRRIDRNTRARPIRRGGPGSLPTTLELKLGSPIKRSRNAGDYVCNFSMYVMLDHIRRAGADTRFGFIHIPHDADLGKATRTVAVALARMRFPAGALAPARPKADSTARAPSPT